MTSDFIIDFVQRRGTDAPAFLDRIERIFVASIAPVTPARLWIVRVDHFFDRRWFMFAGKILGAAGVHYRERIVVPPFHPHRVVEQRRMTWTKYGYGDDPGRVIHYRQHSEANMRRRRVLNEEDDGSIALLWFSGDSATSDKASAMSHVVDGRDSFSWYATFDAKNAWAPSKIIGTDVEHLSRLETFGERTVRDALAKYAAAPSSGLGSAAPSSGLGAAPRT